MFSQCQRTHIDRTSTHQRCFLNVSVPMSIGHRLTSGVFSMSAYPYRQDIDSPAVFSQCQRTHIDTTSTHQRCFLNVSVPITTGHRFTSGVFSMSAYPYRYDVEAQCQRTHIDRTSTYQRFFLNVSVPISIRRRLTSGVSPCFSLQLSQTNLSPIFIRHEGKHG